MDNNEFTERFRKLEEAVALAKKHTGLKDLIIIGIHPTDNPDTVTLMPAGTTPKPPMEIYLSLVRMTELQEQYGSQSSQLIQ